MALPVVKMSMAKKIIEMTFNEGEKRPVFLLGKGGIGKSEVIATLAKELGVGYIDIRLLLYTETDIKGIPYPDNNKEFTVWLQNDILPRVEKDGERGILVFDEITSAMKSVRTAIYQLLNERKLGNYELPDGWMVVCLGNGEEDGGDYNGLEGNFANRCSIYRVEPDVESFKEYCVATGVNNLVVSYLNWCSGDLHTYNDNESSEDSLLFASPRSWKAVSEILNRRAGVIDEVTKLRIKSNIGTMVGEKFVTFCEHINNAINVEDILQGITDKKPSSREAIYMTIQNIASKIGAEVKADITNNGKASDIVVERLANAINWLLSIETIEVIIMGVKDLIMYSGPEMMGIMLDPRFDEKCPKLEEFADKHKEIFE